MFYKTPPFDNILRGIILNDATRPYLVLHGLITIYIQSGLD